MGRTLYLECTSGISGDMTVAALLDLGAGQERLEEALAGVPLGGFSTRVSRVTKSGLDACDFDVILDDGLENHDHDMAWLFGHEDAKPGGKRKRDKKAKKRAKAAMTQACATPAPVACQTGGLDALLEAHAREIAAESEARQSETTAMQGPTDSDDPTLPHEHVPTQPGAEDMAGAAEAAADEHHHHDHRTLADVTAILDATPLTPRARTIAGDIFGRLAAAEAEAHGVPVSQVHFHEVGSVDSIVDVVSVAVCLDDLDVTEVVVPELSEGRGTIRCAHGILPIPVPAVTAITRAARIPLHMTNVRGELVTPTGAAIVAAVRTQDRLPERFVVDAVGLGAGKRAYEGCSGILRALLITPLGPGRTQPTSAGDSAGFPGCGAETPSGSDGDLVCKLECDVDDCTGEALAHAIDELMALGAREAHATPVVMKKGRPGYQLQVLCSPADAVRMEQTLFECTTTIGVRRTLMERTCLARESVCLQTPFGSALGKQVTLPGGVVRTYPEYDSVAALAHRAGVPFQDAYRAVVAAGTRASEARMGRADEAEVDAHLTLVDEDGVRPLLRVITPADPDDGDGDDE